MIPYLSRGNKKYKLAGLRTRTFGLPAWQSKEGFRTCPGAGLCRKGCYAQQGRYVCTQTLDAQHRRLSLVRSGHFVPTMDLELRRLDLVRIHDSGDFFSLSYLKDWLELIRRHPEIKFLTYTKMVPLFRRVVVPPNFTVVFSEGGKFDSQIDRHRDKFSRVFPNLEELRASGFTDCHLTDVPALDPKVMRIGLIYHGWASRAFKTS